MTTKFRPKYSNLWDHLPNLPVTSLTNTVAIFPEFVETLGTKLFVVRFEPENYSDLGQSILFIPPFAEEMNRCRRMISIQARALAKLGFTVIVFDLFGTGDSDGDFSEATWCVWKENVASMVQWCLDRGSNDVSFIAVRLGALLLFESGPSVVSHAKRIILWQPCINGKLFLRQFLRLRLAAHLKSDTGESETTENLMACLRRGQNIEIAGYELSRELALPIEDAACDFPSVMPPNHIDWMEVVASDEALLSPGADRFLKTFENRQASATASAVVGARFWDTVETSVVPGIVETTLNRFMER